MDAGGAAGPPFVMDPGGSTVTPLPIIVNAGGERSQALAAGAGGTAGTPFVIYGEPM